MSMSANVHLPNPRYSDGVTTVEAKTIHDDDRKYGRLSVSSSSADGVNVTLFINTVEQAEALFTALSSIVTGLVTGREDERVITVDPTTVRARIEVGDDGIARPVRI